ncbi:MAG: riboflavin synthase [Verrucomicrobiota bacterium]
MFTGLVEETGEVVSLETTQGGGVRLWLYAPLIAPSAALGDSVAVNGCCLTVSGKDGARLQFDLLQETLARTSLGGAHAGSLVNLERALSAGARFGGHFVQGHIDGTAEILRIEPSGADLRLQIALPVEGARYLVAKGSIAVDGISLTVAELAKDSFTLWIIPHTREVTNLRTRKAGDRVNLEYDLLAKYVERMLEARNAV